MPPTPDSNRIDFEQEQRAAEILQRFFDRTVSSAEAEELLNLLDRVPGLEKSVRENRDIEDLFRFRRSSKKTLSPVRLEELKQACYDALGLSVSETSKTESEDSTIWIGFPNADELVRLAAESPSLLPTTEASAMIPKHSSLSRPKPYRPQKAKSLPWILLFSAVVLITAIWYEFNPSSQSEQDVSYAVARIAENVEAEWEEGAEAFKVGRELEPCVLKLKSGIVKLEFADGAEVILEGPTEFFVKGPETAFCRQGRLSAFVPPKAVGFEVVTPTLAVVDLGTEFAMVVEEEKSDVHVLTGKVELKQSARNKYPLEEGWAAKLQLGGELKTEKADPSIFFSSARLSEKKRNYIERRQAVWDERLRNLLADPALMYRLVPEEISHLKHTPGSHEGKTAICFTSRNDIVDVFLEKEIQSLTLIATVRLTSLKNVSNTLLMGNEFYAGRGGVLWQIDRSGIVRFHLGTDDEKTIYRYDTPPILRRQDQNTWLTLAVVANAENKTVTHYVDERPVCRLPWKNTAPIRLAEATLGNEAPSREKINIRYFNGAVEDFWIFARPFTPEEIAEYHTKNQ